MGLQEKFDSEGYSEYPGNINCFLINFNSYYEKMNNFKNFKEIANPKIDSEGRLISPFRLEVLMQDVSHLFGPNEKVSVTLLDKIFAETSAKNDLVTGLMK